MKMDKIFIKLSQKLDSVTALDVKLAFTGKPVKKEAVTLLQLFDIHNSFFERRVHKGERSKATLEKHERVRLFVSQFIYKKPGVKDIPLYKVDNNFVFELED